MGTGMFGGLRDWNQAAPRCHWLIDVLHFLLCWSWNEEANSEAGVTPALPTLPGTLVRGSGGQFL